MYDVLIFGAGPAGLSAAIWCARLELKALVLEAAPEPGGQLRQITGIVRDYPGLPGVSAAELRQRLVEHVGFLGVEVRCHASPLKLAVTTAGVTARVGADTWSAHYGLIATGTRPRRIGIPGEAEMTARGEVWRGTRDGPRLRGYPVAVIGGGDRAVENALLLSAFAERVYLIRRSDRWAARGALCRRLDQHPNITVLSGHRVVAIHGNHAVESLTIVGPDGSRRLLAVSAVLIYIGQQPNSEPFAPWVALTGDGRILAGDHGSTSHPRLFAAGDVAVAQSYSSITGAAGQGAAVAKQIALLL